MRALLPTLEAWAAEGQAPARAVVVRTYGSAPRREGAVMLVADDGRMAGSVSGGCVEGATAGLLAEARSSGLEQLVRFGVSDEQAWGVGLACGGTIDVLIQPAVPEAVLRALRQSSVDRAGGQAVVIRLPAGSGPASDGGFALGTPTGSVAPIVVHADGRLEGSLGDPSADDELRRAAMGAIGTGRSLVVEVAGRSLFIEVFAVRPRLLIIGGVPVGQALARLARELDYEIVVIDARPAFATRERFPDVDELIVGWPDEVADEVALGPADAVAVLSHDAKVDEPAIVEALRRGCRYVGAIGSRKTQAARRERLLELGLSAEQVGRLHGPIGLDLGGNTPTETALAILAEIVATRYGASAGSMRAS